MKKNIFSYLRVWVVAVTALTTLGVSQIQAFPTSQYAEVSALASGKWARIKVSQSGMQFVSDTQLAALGFSDPSKVNVYGFGGAMISETLDESHPDDLPLLPSVRTANGIVFFGVDHIKWETAKNYSNYQHTMQPYAEESYYFLSDIPVDRQETDMVDLTSIDGLELADSFIERIVHEKDLMAPSNTGRNLLGEDLRTAQQFNFSLPGNVGGDAWLTMVVASNLSGASGMVRLTSSNSSLSQATATVDAMKSSEQFMRTNTSRFTASGVGENLNLGLTLTTSAVIKLARLDYIRVEYERELRMPSDQLYFYFNENSSIGASLKGITSETQIWDVTKGHAPKRVEFVTEGGEARFRVKSGYHEFVAFNPSKISRGVEPAGTIANQNLHGMESPDMLIISPEEYLAPAERVAEMHRQQDGMTVYVLTPQQIYNEFSSGTPDVSAFRKAMKMWYDRDMEAGEQKIKYCLIFSRPTYDNKMVTSAVKGAGYPRVPIWQSATGFTENTSYSTDDFIGMLDDVVNSMGTAKIRVAVGRFPVRSLEEANAMADKLIAYTTNTDKSAWRNNVLLFSDDQDNGQHLDQTEKMYAEMIVSDKGKDYQYERLYLDTFERKLTSTGYEYPGAKKRFFSKLEEGQSLLTYIGHANTVMWTHEHVLTWKDITSMSNTRLPIVYAATCEFARWDADDYSGAEVMWALPKTGAIAVICPSRSVFINMNGPLSAQFGKYALVRNEDGTPTRLGDSFVNMKNGMSGSDDNKLRYSFLGDPAMKMPVYSYNVEVKSIYDVDINEPGVDLPVVEARSNPVVKGVVTDFEGNVATDFNGYVYLKLYDAEKVIETLGNGSEGRKMIYNDRKTRLFDGAAKVENGEWELTIYMPTEIENNFTQGRMTLYALASDGREANGASDKFFVYGYNQDAPEDMTGPEITSFYLNRDTFQDGDVSYKTPVVYATFTDESGINISDAGIGHSLTLTLDGKTVFSDLINFYNPDLNDNRTGSITYQLPEIEAGKHELTFQVWDCANNSSTSSISFNIAAVKEPDIFDIETAFSADRSGVEFIVNSDRPLANLTCDLEVFDMNGIRMWHASTDDRTDASSAIRLKWDYTTPAGHKVAKGIYFCRATVISPEGKTAKKSKKIVVSY